MDEGEARSWVQRTFDVPRETMDRLDAFGNLLRSENERQNLVSRTSLSQLWARHIADSAQLLLWARAPPGSWADLGAGAGFPGLVVGAISRMQVTMIEERRLRVDFLTRAVSLLGIADRTRVEAKRVERVRARPFDVISARAFAPLPRLFELGERFSTLKTRWILPKGRNARSELEAAESSWQGDFRLERSVTDPDAWIILADEVKRKP